MRSASVCKRYKVQSKIALTSLYQTVLEVLVTAAARYKKSKSQRVNATHVRRAVTENAALRALFGDVVTLVGGGYRRTRIPRSKDKYALDPEDHFEGEAESEDEQTQAEA